MLRLFACWALALGLLTSAARAHEIGELLRQARAERDAGELEVALSTLERARAVAPEHADVLLLLGQIQGYAGRHDQALSTLGRAKELAPDYLDVRLAIVRVQLNQGAQAAAEHEVQALRDLAADEPRVLLLAARVAFSSGDLQLARARFEAARRLDPEASEPLVGLGDIAMAEGDPFTAQGLYERALEGSPDDASLFDRLLQARDRAKRWRIESEIGFSQFDDARSSWREAATRLTYRLDARTALTGTLETGERYQLSDTYLEIALGHRWSAVLSGYLAAGTTFDPDFRERFAIRGGGAVRVRRTEGTFGPTVLTLDTRYADYDTAGATVTLTPGLQQYLLDGWLTLTGRWINVVEADGRHLHGPLVRLDGRPDDRVGLYIGLAAAPESQGPVVVDTRSVFGGVALGIDEDTVVRTSVAHETRELGATRTAVTLGVAVEF